MTVILDTADLEEIRKWNDIIGINYITTNPHLLMKQDVDSIEKFGEFVLELEEIIEGPTIFFQCISKDDVYMLKELRDKLETKTKVNFVAKVSMSPEFYPLIKKANEYELMTAATTCYDLAQIHQAGEFGMDFSMVYFAKNDNETLLKDAIHMVGQYDYSITLVAASFRTKKDFITAIKSGISAATVPPSVLKLAYTNNDTKSDIERIFALKKV